MVENKKSKIILINLIYIIIIFSKKKIKEKELYTHNENYNCSMIEAAEIAKDFINKSMNGYLFNNKIFEYNNNPIVSVVIPVYNNEKIIIRTITSIQNQNMENIEIILVNDFSRDNTSFIIKHLQQKDNRIIMINNNKNMGILYSRCIGVLSSKGKYIFPLDNDDMFLDRDVFDIIYKVADKNNLDIVKFNGIQVKGIDNFFKNRLNKILFTEHKKNVILHQPELSNFPIRRNKYDGNYVMEDVYLWSKCIRSETYKKAVSLYKKERYSIYMTSWEDNIINYILFQLSNSFIFNPKYGILRIEISSSTNHITPIIIYLQLQPYSYYIF